MPAISTTGYTTLITVSDTQYTAVIARSCCHDVIVGEDPSVVNWPTTNFYVAKPEPTNSPRQIPVGQSYAFSHKFDRKPYSPGDIAGYIKCVSGTTTFFQDETPL